MPALDGPRPLPRVRPRARPRVRRTHRQEDTVSAVTRLTRARWQRCDTNHSHSPSGRCGRGSRRRRASSPARGPPVPSWRAAQTRLAAVFRPATAAAHQLGTAAAALSAAGGRPARAGTRPDVSWVALPPTTFAWQPTLPLVRPRAPAARAHPPPPIGDAEAMAVDRGAVPAAWVAGTWRGGRGGCPPRCCQPPDTVRWVEWVGWEREATVGGRPSPSSTGGADEQDG